MALTKTLPSTLKDKRIVVLGGTSGIGLAVARAAAAEGAELVVASSDPDKVQAATAGLPGSEGRVADLSSEAEIQRLFADLGAFDHLVYCAGEALALMPMAEVEVEAARRFFNIRYWGAFAAAKYGHRSIRAGGSIVFSSGTAGARPGGAGWAVASSICAGMEGLTRALAVELQPIRVNVVAPGIVRTPLWRAMDETAREELYAASAARLPVGHVGEPEEIAEGYLYLMRQSYGSGQTLYIDGGDLLV